MQTCCPHCKSANIKRNGNTYYKKQNHKCKDCHRQFVLNNAHTIPEDKKAWIKAALKERLSLRAITRIFKVSLTWLANYAHTLWEKSPENLGLTEEMLSKIEKLQVFGLQADELWSFVQKKKRKQWIWVVYDPVHRLVVAMHIGGRGVRDAKKLWRKIPETLRHCTFETDDWDAYKKIVPKKQHKIGKNLTYYIEGFNATVRARVSRLVRKTLSFSKLDKWHNLAIQWFFWQFNVERKPYM